MKSAEEARKQYDMAVAQREATQRKLLNEFVDSRVAFMKRNVNLKWIENRIESEANSCETHATITGLDSYASKTYIDAPSDYRLGCKQYFYDKLMQVFEDNNKYFRELGEELKKAGYTVALKTRRPIKPTSPYTNETYEPDAISVMEIKW